MSKEKQIELLEKQLAFWKHHCTGLIKSLDDAEETAKRYAELLDKTEDELNAERVNIGWISVEERLPEEDTIVLVWCGEYAVYNYLRDDMWYTGYCDISTDDGGVTHWMPLPEAPKGGEE